MLGQKPRRNPIAEELQLKLLGNLEIRRSGNLVTGFTSIKVRVLPCYLAATAKSRRREEAMKQVTGWMGVFLAVALAAGGAPVVGQVGRTPAGLEAGAWNVWLVGQWGGATYTAAVQGSYVYVGQGPRLAILDVTDPAAPLAVGKTAPLPGIVMEVVVPGNAGPMASGYAYVADFDSGLRVVDVSDPTQPVEVGFHQTPGHAYGVAVAGVMTYVADGETGLRVVDVSDPTQPVGVGSYDTPGFAYGVAVAGGYAYVADSAGRATGGGHIRPGAADRGRATAMSENARGVAVAGGYAYVADSSGGLRVVDVSDPAQPIEVGLQPFGGCPRGGGGRRVRLRCGLSQAAGGGCIGPDAAGRGGLLRHAGIGLRRGGGRRDDVRRRR